MNPLLSIGLPVLSRIVGKALGKSENQGVSNLGQSLLNISDNELTASQVHEQYLTEIRADVDLQRQINETYRAELRSEDRYVKRWRPTLGYCITGCFVGELFLIPMTKIILISYVSPELANAFDVALGSPEERAVIWVAALSVLGVGVTNRSQDKKAALGQPTGLGALLAMVKKS